MSYVFNHNLNLMEKGNIYNMSVILSSFCGALQIWITAAALHPSFYHKILEVLFLVALSSSRFFKDSIIYKNCNLDLLRLLHSVRLM
jgi:hypothetical protein